MIRTVIKLAIVVLLVHAVVKIVPVFWTYVRFKDALGETAKFAAKLSPQEVEEKALGIASRMDVPIGPADVDVQKQGDVTIIDTRYTGQLEYFPKRFYPWEFVIHVAEQPPRYDSVLR